MNFLDSLFKIIIYNEGHLRRIKKDNNIPDDIIMQSHLTEFALTIKDIVARIIQRAKDENVDIDTYIEQIESYNGFMKEFTPPTGSFLDQYRQSLNLNTKLQTEQIDLSQ